MDAFLKNKNKKKGLILDVLLWKTSLKSVGVLPEQSVQDQAQDVATHLLAGMNDFLYRS